MTSPLAAYLIAVWGMVLGFLLLRYGPVGLGKLHAPIVAQADKLGLGEPFRLVARWQLLIVRLGGALCLLAAMGMFATAVLASLGVIELM